MSLSRPPIINCVNSDIKPFNIDDGTLSVYCERKHGFPVKTVSQDLKLSGEDGYPLSTSQLLIAADGVGSGNAKHGYVNAKCNKELINKLFDMDVDEVLDYFKNRKPGDPQAYKEEYLNLIKYALDESFAPSPPNSFYNYLKNDREVERAEQMAQMIYPDSEDGLKSRYSSHLGSRLFSIAVYKWCIDHPEFISKDDWTDEKARTLVSHLEDYLSGEFKNRAISGNDPMFKYDDVIRMRPDVCYSYYLATVLCATLFSQNSNEKSGDVSALVIWAGDAHCYKIDGIDGVKCVMKENSNAGGSITNFCGFPQNKNRKVNKLSYTIVKAKKPCAFLCCSDGIYDTCTLPEGEYSGAGQGAEFAFQLKLLNMLKNCHSLDDVFFGLGYTFYYGVEDWKLTDKIVDVYATERSLKKDDSGIGALKCFWTDSVKSFSEMLSAKPGKTTLERVFALHKNGLCSVLPPLIPSVKGVAALFKTELAEKFAALPSCDKDTKQRVWDKDSRFENKENKFENKDNNSETKSFLNAVEDCFDTASDLSYKLYEFAKEKFDVALDVITKDVDAYGVRFELWGIQAQSSIIMRLKRDMPTSKIEDAFLGASKLSKTVFNSILKDFFDATYWYYEPGAETEEFSHIIESQSDYDYIKGLLAKLYGNTDDFERCLKMDLRARDISDAEKLWDIYNVIESDSDWTLDLKRKHKYGERDVDLIKELEKTASNRPDAEYLNKLWKETTRFQTWKEDFIVINNTDKCYVRGDEIGQYKLIATVEDGRVIKLNSPYQVFTSKQLVKQNDASVSDSKSANDRFAG